MSDRITERELETMARRVHELSVRLELLTDGHELRIDVGSVTYGRAWRLYSVEVIDGRAVGGHHDGPYYLGSGYLGSTRREAFATLRGMVRALETVAEARRVRARHYRSCGECGRRFDMLDDVDAAEWSAGHDCEVA
jgi:uncharacterized membrane protein YedE/YeeE